jgi:transposase-like protein
MGDSFRSIQLDCEDRGKGEQEMGRKRHTAEQIIAKLREAEVDLARGKTTVEVARKLGITEQTYYRWRKEYGGLRVDQAKRLKMLEKENARLKRLVAEQALDNAILKEVSSGNF